MESKNKQQEKRCHCDHTEHREGNGEEVILHQSDQEKRKAVTGSQRINGAFFRQEIHDNEGFKADHGAAAEHMGIDQPLQRFVRQRQEEPQHRGNGRQSTHTLRPDHIPGQENHIGNGQYIAPGYENRQVVHINGQGCPAVDIQSRPHKIDEAHLPERKHNKAAQVLQRILPALALIVQKEGVVHSNIPNFSKNPPKYGR